MTPIRTYQVATRIEFGGGASLTVGQEARKLGVRRALLVTDQGIAATGVCDGMRRSLEEAGVAVTVFDQVQPDPNTGNANSAADAYLSADCDGLVALGGGSVIDCSKAAGIVAANGGRIEDYLPLGARPIEKRIPPLIAVPTTAGTGSDVSTSSIITHEATHAKINFASLKSHSEVALLDPELTRTMPPGLTASTGLDALSHGIERFTAVDATPLTDSLALSCIRLVAQNLRQAYANGDNMKARENMMWAALLGAMARAALTSAHAISGVVGAHCHIPHGLCCALLQPPTMEFNLIANPARFAAIAEAMGERIEGLSVLDAAYRSVEAVKRLLVDVGATQRLRDFGLREEEIPEIAETCVKVKPAMLRRDNPRVMSAVDVEAVIRCCY